MANKRILKKQIRNACGALASECIFAMEYIPQVDTDAFAALIARIAALQETSLSNATFDYDKTRADFDSKAAFNHARSVYNRSAFNSLKSHFNNQVEEIVKEMNTLLPHKE